MAVAYARSLLSRPNPQYNKRKRIELTVDLEDTVKRLQDAIDRINELVSELPVNMQPLVDLLRTQTQMIEVLASCRASRSSKRRSHDRRASIDTAKIVCDSAKDTSTRAIIRYLPDQEDSPVERVVHHTSKERTPHLYQPRRQNSHIAAVVGAPATQSSQSIQHRKIPNQYSSDHSLTQPRTISCATCSTRPFYPLYSDLEHEYLVQQATTRIISAMKSKKRIRVGPVDNALFNLYSADYRQNHYCAHDRIDKQSLIVYSHSETWEADFPGITAPGPGEVAMELMVYPDCLLIIKPFKVPNHAGWKWHTLDAIGDDARPTTVEIMFLGDGYLKLKVRLSELLGREGMVDGGPDRWIEFAGVWSRKLNDDSQEIYQHGYDSPVEPVTNGCHHSAAVQVYGISGTKRYVLPPLPPLPPLEHDAN